MNDEGIKKLFDKVEVLEVSDLRNFTKLLWKQREFFKKIFDVIKDSIVVINTKGEILYCNRSAHELLGIEPSPHPSLLWKYVPEFVAFSELNLSPQDKTNTFFSKDIKISYPRKSVLNVTVTSYNNDENDNGGDDKMFVIRILDVTDEREVSRKLLREQKTSSIMLLASGVAHEIGNPLNALALRLEVMKRQLKNSKHNDEKVKMEASVNICLEEIARLDSIVRNFLHAIRPQRPKMTEVLLHKVLEKSLDLMEVEFRPLNIKIINKVEQLPPIFGDSNQLQQVFFNILKNACEAISHDGTILIESFINNNEVVMVFTDDGIGISCEVSEKIFTPYFSTKSGGNGLGMMVVQRILNDHGATMDIASAENVGTKISIHFPRKDKIAPLLHSDSHPNIPKITSHKR